MSKPVKQQKLTMQAPAIYRICVQGHLDPHWADRLGGMNITEAAQDDGDDVETILVGRLEDQAALAGLLNSLYELQLPLLSVDCLESG